MHILVLDLDETLLHTFEAPAEETARYEELTRQFPQRIFSPYPGEFTILRPHLHEFLRWAFASFDYVAVWSAGSYEYVHRMCDHLFVETPDPAFIFSREDCDIRDRTYYKDLSKIPRLARWVPRDAVIILIDDLPINHEINGDYAYTIPAFRTQSIESDDHELERFMSAVSVPPVP